MTKLIMDQFKNEILFGQKDIEIPILPGIYNAIQSGYHIRILSNKKDPNTFWSIPLLIGDTLGEFVITEGIRGMSKIKIKITEDGEIFEV